MAYAVSFNQSKQTIHVKLSTGGMMKATFGTVQYVNTGKQGPQGVPGSDAAVVPLTNLELEKLLV